MAALTLQNIVDAGTKPTFGAAAASDTVVIGSGTNTFLVYKNTDSNAKTVTLVAPGNTSYGQPYPDPALTLGATTGELWIPIRRAYDDGTGTATVNITGTGGVTGVTVAAVVVG